MKVLILKLGVLMFAFLVMVGGYLRLPLYTILLRSFIVFLVLETLLVFIALIYIKMTEKIRVEHEEDEEVAIE